MSRSVFETDRVKHTSKIESICTPTRVELKKKMVSNLLSFTILSLKKMHE